MRLEKAVKIIETMQEWRRGNKPYDKPGSEMPFTPKEYGDALDAMLLFARIVKKYNPILYNLV
jgi:hypothetical protein